MSAENKKALAKAAITTIEVLAIFVGGGWALWQYYVQIKADRVSRSIDLMSQVLSTDGREARNTYFDYLESTDEERSGSFSNFDLNSMANDMARADLSVLAAWDAVARQLGAVGYCVAYDYCDESIVRALLPDDAQIFIVHNHRVIPSIEAKFDSDSDSDLVDYKRYRLQFMSYAEGIERAARAELKEEGVTDERRMKELIDEALEEYRDSGPRGLLSR